MKKIVVIAMALGFVSVDLLAQNTQQRTTTTTRSSTIQQDTSRRRMQDTDRNRQMNERNRTNRLDTGAVTPVDTALNRMK